jgi:DNA polymerase III subunit delta
VTVFWILHGEDEFRRSEFLAKLKTDLGDPTMLEFNTTVVDGRRATLAQITHAADSVPFLGNKRLVIVEGLLSRLSSSGKKQEKADAETSADEALPATQTEFIQGLRDYALRVPESTLLVFVESGSLPASQPLRALVQGDAALGTMREFRPFSVEKREGPTMLAEWTKERAKSKGAGLAPDALRLLTSYVGYDLRLMDQELEKLSVHAGENKKVTETDVRQLVTSVREADIFEMVDALGRRELQRAAILLHQMLDDGKAPLYLLTMIVRQFRIMLEVKELATLGTSEPEIARELRLHEFVVKKGNLQARAFTVDQLTRIYEALAATDEAIKTGKLQEVLALDLLLAEISQI